MDGDNLPKYLKIGRIFALNKQDTSNLPVRSIKTISIHPYLIKFYELVLLQFLEEEEYKRIILIPKKQRGFREKKSTTDNLIDLLAIIERPRENSRGKED